MAKKRAARVSNQLRIVGGKWRGRKLSFPDGEGLRPTIDRVRETLFNWLRGDIANSHCLDLFTGSGALGLEALSQGATHCTFVEKNPLAVSAIKSNLSVLNCKDASVVHQDAFEYLTQCQQQFDLIFLDPPFGKEMLQNCCDAIAQYGLLGEDGLVYLESEQDLEKLTMPAGWELIRHKKAGQSHYGLVHFSLE